MLLFSPDRAAGPPLLQRPPDDRVWSCHRIRKSSQSLRQPRVTPDHHSSVLRLAGTGEKLFNFEDVSCSAKLQDYLKTVLIIKIISRNSWETIINSDQIVIIFKAITVHNISGLFFESIIHKMFELLNTDIARHSITEFELPNLGSILCLLFAFYRLNNLFFFQFNKQISTPNKILFSTSVSNSQL